MANHLSFLGRNLSVWRGGGTSEHIHSMLAPKTESLTDEIAQGFPACDAEDDRFCVIKNRAVSCNLRRSVAQFGISKRVSEVSWIAQGFSHRVSQVEGLDDEE